MNAMNTVDFCALPYYRPSRWNGNAMKPALLQVGDGRIRVTAHDDSMLFDEPVGACTVKAGAMGVMKITTPQRAYEFYGRGAAISADPNPAQVAYVQQFWTTNPPYPQLRDDVLNYGMGGLKKLAKVLEQAGLRKA